MVQTATPDMIPELKQLWRVCFGDSAAGTEFVFDNLLRPQRILVQTDESDLPVAMLCWHPLTFSTPKGCFDGAYIFGVGTAPNHRGQGISTALLEKAENILREQDMRLSCLVPASENLFDFYAQRGYQTQLYYKLLQVSAEQMPVAALGGELVCANLEDFVEARYQGSTLADSSLLGIWDAEYLRYTGAECRFYGGEVLRFTSFEEESMNYAACYPDGKGGILVKEVLLFDSEDLEPLLAALHRHFGAKSYSLRLPTDFALEDKWETQTLPFAMTKWYYKEDTIAAAAGGAPWFAFGLDG